MTQDDANQHEWISALADGQLRGEDFTRALELLDNSSDARATWHTYHLVGDVLRSGALMADCAQDAAFVGRLQQRLQSGAQALEVAQATHLRVSGESLAPTQALQRHDVEGANDASFRWKLVAGFASLAAVVIAGWHVVSGLDPQDVAPQLAQVRVPSLEQPVDVGPMVMIRDPRLDQLLAAHQQFGGTSALQMPAGFLRNATFEKPAR